MEVLKRKGAEVEGKTAVTGIPEEKELGWMDAQDPNRKREEKFAEKEVAEQKK